MKRLIVVLLVLGVGCLAPGAMAFNYHTNVNLICSDCHTAHASQQHGNGDARGGIFQNVPIAGGPHPALLRNAVNDLCLTCHDGNAGAPDVYGPNTGKYAGTLRQAGTLNKVGDGGENNGHTLNWTGLIPGSDGISAPTTLAGTEGLECVNCHSPHGSKTQYRNLMSRNASAELLAGGSVSFLYGSTGKTLTYEINANPQTVTNTKDVVMTAEQDYNPDHIQFEEPFPDSSRYGNWCKTCHAKFHGSGGSDEMGSVSGGALAPGGENWLRHPAADVNIGGYITNSATHVSSLTQYYLSVQKGPGHYAKVMDSKHLWTADTTGVSGGNAADATVTASCMSCHKAHGNTNPFGLIFMGGAGPATEQGDGGTFRTMCRQCHSEGS